MSPATEPSPPPPRQRRAPPSEFDRERDSLRVVIESIGREADLAPLLARILDYACGLLDADRGAIGLVDEARNVVRMAAARDMPVGELGTEVPIGVGLVGHVLQTRAPVSVRRYAELPFPSVPALAEDPIVGVPIRWGDAIIGVFGLGRTRPRPFAPRDVAMLEDFARHAAIAVHNAQRLAVEQRRGERLALIAHVGHLVAADLQRDEVLQRAADAIHELLGYENVAVALLRPEEPDALLLRSFGGAYKHDIGGEHRLPLTQGLMAAAARTGEIVLVNDVARDPRYLPTPGMEGTHAELVVPLLLGGRVLGVLNVEQQEPFGAEDVHGLRIVADQLAVAIENARLYETAQRAAVLEERHRLARELHDSVTQQLFSATLVAQAVGPAYARDPAEGDRRAAMLLELTRGALGEMRALLAELRPWQAGSAANGGLESPDAGLTGLRREGLVAALRAHLRTAAATDGPTVTLADDGWAPLPPAREEALYRIAREALHNAVKHARAGTVEIRLGVAAGVARVTVRDDGAGFDAHERAGAHRRAAASGGLGLPSMRERAAEAGGALRIDSAPGRGTLVEVMLPLGGEGIP
ncbi:MAG: GAF domain-containing sensor histidine kinase [Gemmatirosa sp.]|nr:GAF domain-containing sensor histidine kinase [Gemmatirosa sp.]